MSLSVPEGYRALAEDSVAAYLAGLPDIRARLGGAPEDWRVREVGDGNLNLVFIVKGPSGGLVVKQALPYVRLVGESWPLPLERAYFEHHLMREGGSMTRVAERTGLERTHLYRKLKQLGVDLSRGNRGG